VDIVAAVQADHTYSCHKTIEQKLQEKDDKLTDTRKKLVAISRKHKKLQETVEDLQNMLKDVKNKFNIQDHVHDLLKQAASEIPEELFTRLTKNLSRNTTSREEYPPALRTFALTLHFYSPRAYRY
jgi:peptidoglycan hydrolase CwlO-like protein